jgi:hypothetical protein
MGLQPMTEGMRGKASGRGQRVALFFTGRMPAGTSLRREAAIGIQPAAAGRPTAQRSPGFMAPRDPSPDRAADDGGCRVAVRACLAKSRRPSDNASLLAYPMEPASITVRRLPAILRGVPDHGLRDYAIILGFGFPIRLRGDLLDLPVDP